MNSGGQFELQYHHMGLNSNGQPAVPSTHYQQPTNKATFANFHPVDFQEPPNAEGAPVNARAKRVRTQFSAEQLIELEKEFTKNIYVSKERREELVLRLSLTSKQIKVWFQNKRMKTKKEQREAQQECPETVPFDHAQLPQPIVLPNAQYQPFAQLPHSQVLHPQPVPSTHVAHQPPQSLLLPSAPPQDPLGPHDCLQVRPMQQVSLQPENQAYGLPQPYQVPGQWDPPQQDYPCCLVGLELAVEEATPYDQDFSDLFEVLENMCG